MSRIIPVSSICTSLVTNETETFLLIVTELLVQHSYLHFYCDICLYIDSWTFIYSKCKTHQEYICNRCAPYTLWLDVHYFMVSLAVLPSFLCKCLTKTTAGEQSLFSCVYILTKAPSPSPLPSPTAQPMPKKGSLFWFNGWLKKGYSPSWQWSHCVRSMRQESHFICSQEAEKDEQWCSAWFPFVASPASPAHRTVPPLSWASLPSSFKPLWAHCQTHTQMCVSWVTPTPFKLTVKINHHIV